MYLSLVHCSPFPHSVTARARAAPDHRGGGDWRAKKNTAREGEIKAAAVLHVLGALDLRLLQGRPLPFTPVSSSKLLHRVWLLEFTKGVQHMFASTY